MMLAVYIVLTVLVIASLRYILGYLAYRREMNQLPGEAHTHPLLGDLKTYPGNGEAGLTWAQDKATAHKYFHRFWAGPLSCCIMVYHPDSMREVIKHSVKPRNVGVVSTTYDMFARWLGEGLVTTNSAHWHRHRRLLTHCFHFDVLKKYVDVYNSCTGVMIDCLSDVIEVSGPEVSGSEVSVSPEVSVDIQELTSKLTLDVILQSAFSLHSDCQVEETPSQYAHTIGQLQSLWLKRWLNPLVYFEAIYGLTGNGRRFYQLCDVIHQQTADIIRRRQEENEKKESEQFSKQTSTNNNVNGSTSSTSDCDFLDILLKARDEDGTGLTPQEIQDEVDTFLFAGHDTTASGLAWTLYCLAQHPSHQEQVFEEVKDVLGGREEVTYDDLGKLTFTAQCIKEALRLHTAVPGIERVTTQDIQLQGHRVKAGTRVMVHLWGLHNNPHVWDCPREFRPQRFSPDNQATMDPYQFIPFSAGSRNCLGQNFGMNEMKVALVKLINNFRFRADAERPPDRVMTMTLKSTTGVWMFVSPRQTSDTAGYLRQGISKGLLHHYA